MYQCSSCDESFEVHHSMSEKLTDCDSCETDDSLKRVPSQFFVKQNNIDNNKKTGDIVNEFIKDTTEELKQEKKELKNRELNK